MSREFKGGPLSDQNLEGETTQEFIPFSRGQFVRIRGEKGLYVVNELTEGHEAILLHLEDKGIRVSLSKLEIAVDKETGEPLFAERMPE